MLIYFMVVTGVIVTEELLKRYLKKKYAGGQEVVDADVPEGGMLGNFPQKLKQGGTELLEKLSQKLKQGGAELLEKLSQKIRQGGAEWKEKVSQKLGESALADKVRRNVRIELLENRGACGGLLAGNQGLLRKISAVLLGAGAGELVLQMIRKRRVTGAGIGLSLLLGGGLANFLDRVRTGSVTDYLRFPEFPVKKIRNLVFNIADFCIFAGTLLLLVFRKER